MFIDEQVSVVKSAFSAAVNPTIYVSCIKQFWRTVAVKSSNDVIRLQALVDKKRVVVTEAAIRDALHLDDAEGVDCLPNEEIFAELACMGYEKPTTKLTFYKAFFSSQWKVGKGCSGVETPLFKGMLVSKEPEEQGDVKEQGNAEEQGNADTTAEESEIAEVLDACAALARRVEHLEQDKVAQDLEIIKLNTRVKKLEKTNKAKTLKLRRLRKVGTSQRVDTFDDTLMEDVSNQGVIDRDEDVVKEVDKVREYTANTQVEGRQADIYNIEMDHAAKILIVAAVSETVSAAAVIPSVVLETISDAAAVPTVIAPPVKVAAPVKVVVPSTRQKRGVRRNHLQKLLLKPAPRTREKNTAGFRLDYFKGMNYDDIRPIFVAKYNANMEFLLKSKEQMEEEESRAIALINQTLAQKAAKKRKLIEEANEAESIKQHLQIVPDEDDDVFTEATPLARKVPVVDYHVILVNNKPRYKIIKADDTHQLNASFITMLKNFDREDLETLWKIVKERFSTSKLNNFLDEYLLKALKTMFERQDGQDNVWRNQSTVHGQALVKNWKLLTSCGVHIISFNTTQIILLVERSHPLTKFTLEQMLNVVRLQVEEECEMSLELIRFTRQQLQEGQHN
nr:hypothetical protein [Tanacetum cinerariifolium]